MTSTLNKLKERGIYDSAIELGCTIEGDKLFIPICTLSGRTIAKRVKNFGDGLKYFWSPSKPKNPIAEWFIAPKTKQAIADNNGVVYLANGEPAMMAMLAANVRNVICTTLSEISVPKNIIDVFEQLGITELRYLKDNDVAGSASAINWRDALLSTDVKFIAYDMPDYLADKADINDLWIYHGFSAGNFQDALTGLYKAMLPLPEVKPVIEYDTELANTPQALIDAIINRLGIQHFNSDGWSNKKVVSPFRADDKDPSFNLNRNTGVGGDWGTGEYYSPYAIAKELNIKYDNPSPKQVQQYETIIIEASVIEPIEYELSDSELLPGGRKSWINQDKLPKSWIQAILTLTDTRSAVTTLFIKLHAAFRSGALNPNNFTLKEIRDTLYDGKRRPSTKAALETLQDLKVVRDSCAYSIYKEIPNKPLQLEIIGNPTLINLDLLDMLDRYILEHHTSKAIAPRLHTLFNELELNLDDAKQWHDRCESLVNAETAYRIDADKRYWLEELTGDNRYQEMDYDTQDDNLGLRAKLITEYLNCQIKNQIQMSQHEIMRLCGLKSASFKPLFKEANIVTELQYRWHSVDKPNSCNLKQELNAATQAKNNDGRGGHLVWMVIKPVGGKYGRPIYKHTEMIEAWEQLKSGNEDKPTIFGINIRVQLPSLVRFKTEQEITDAEKVEQEKALEKAQDKTPVIVPEQEANDTTQADTQETPVIVDKPRPKTRYSGKRDRSWDKHDKQWLYTQLQAEMYCWLNQELKESGHVFGKDGSTDIRLSGSSDIIRYINEQIILNDIDKPYHRAETFFNGESLDFGIENTQDEKDTIEAVEVELEPIMIEPIAKPKKQRLTLAESRAWGNSEDKIGYLESIGVK